MVRGPQQSCIAQNLSEKSTSQCGLKCEVVSAEGDNISDGSLVLLRTSLESPPLYVILYVRWSLMKGAMGLLLDT